MRLFIAVPLPPAAEAAAMSLLDELRARDWPVRWVRDHGLHLTLKFFGEVTSDRVDAIAEMLAFAARDLRAIGLSFEGTGVFPDWEKPRVLYLGVEPAPELELLQDRIERGGERLGFPPEGRPFRPHLTLGRVREGQRLPPGWREVFERSEVGSPFLANRVVLFESSLTPKGPSYTARLAVPLT